MKTAQRSLLSLIFITLFVLLPKSAFASTLHLSPGGGNIGVGQTFAVQVKLNTAGQAVNAVTALLSYPTDKLDVAYVTPGSAFSIEAEKVVGGGNIRISRGNISGVSGDVVVATIGFRGKTLGDAKVSFISGSGAPSATSSTDTLNLGGSAGGSFTVVPAVKSSSTPSALGPKISDIKVIESATSSATITWTTDRKSSSEVDYGVDKSQFVLSVVKSDLVTEHTLKLENLQFPAGTKLYFQVKSKDAAGAESISEINTIQLKGYQVIIKLTSKDGKPISNVKVTLYSDPLESATNDQGQVVFEDVAPGKHVALIQSGSLEKSQDIEVVDNGNLDLAQEFSFIFDPVNSTTARPLFNINSKNNLAMVVLGLSLLILLGIAIYIFRKRQSDGGSGPTGGNSSPFPFFDSNNQSGNQTPVVIHPGQS